MAKIDWLYCRKNCESCEKAQAFFDRRKVTAEKTDDARKTRFTPQAAVALAKSAHTLYVSKGKQVVRVDLKKNTPADAELEALIIGPSGNLRAPSFIAGKNMMVGFHEPTYAELLG